MKKTTLLDKEPISQVPTPDYNAEELLYLKNLRKKITNARDKREQPFQEFDGRTYTEYWHKCEELANTSIQPKKHKNDITYKSGTLRTKLFTVLSNILGLNLSPDIASYSHDNVPINSIGNALEIILWKCDELDGDEEKKLLRFYELVVRGFVFVEELWEPHYTITKNKVNAKGKFRGVKITATKKLEMSNPTRNIIPSLNVFLGDLTKTSISEQPYIYTVVKMRYDVAEKIYGKYEMWKYVSKQIKPLDATISNATDSSLWFFNELNEEYVELVKYQDKPNKEFQVIINGVPMMPIGMPFPWGFNEYNITQQNLRPIRHNFAYGKSFLFENKNVAELIDSFTRYNIIKTLKSIYPSYLNISTKVISNDVLQPATITMGIQPNALQPINQKESEGITQSEQMMLESMMRNLDQNTVSQTFSGQQENKSGITATQILELQKQAKIMLGVLITCAALLEQKLATLRLFNVLNNWFEEDDSLTQAKKMIKTKYRTVTKKSLIPGEGEGLKAIIPIKKNKMPSSTKIRAMEDKYLADNGKPIRLIFLDPDEIKTMKLIWVVTVNPREKKTSELYKIMFSQMLQEAINLGLTLNMKYVSERFAEVWEEDPSKLFTDAKQAPEEIQQMGQQTNTPNPKAQANIKPQVQQNAVKIEPKKE